MVSAREKEEFYGSAPFVCLLLRIEQNQGHLNEQVILIPNLPPTIWIIEVDGRNQIQARKLKFLDFKGLHKLMTGKA